MKHIKDFLFSAKSAPSNTGSAYIGVVDQICCWWQVRDQVRDLKSFLSPTNTKSHQHLKPTPYTNNISIFFRISILFPIKKSSCICRQYCASSSISWIKRKIRRIRNHSTMRLERLVFVILFFRPLIGQYII